MATRLDEGTPGSPLALFQLPLDVAGTLSQYAVTSDGQRFLALVRVKEPPRLRVIVNLPKLLSR